MLKNIFYTPANSTQTVVSHDTSTIDPQAAKVNVAVATPLTIEQLVAEREAWEQNAYRTSNEQLYVILQKCYQFYKNMEDDTDDAKALRNAFKKYIEHKALRFNKGSHTLVKIIKCVFGADRRRVSAYGVVLRSALAQDKYALDIPTFIREGGGVEEIRLSKAPNAMTTNQKAVAASRSVAVSNIGHVKSVVLDGKLDAGKIGTDTVFIGTWQADGSVILRAVVESESVLKAALASYYNSSKADIKTKAFEQEAANDDSLKQQAICKAVNACLVVA